MSIVEEHARALMDRYAFTEIRVPVLERLQLYQRSTGDTTDIVEKQMYAFADRDEAETTVAMRPEGTPGVVRAYIDAGLDRRDPEQRFFYSGPMFRRERPQKGRYRQFYQFGVEVFGRADAACDAELLTMISDLGAALEITLQIQINSIGCPECRPNFRAALIEWGRANWAKLCEDCHNRIERNPLRLLDCKIDVELAKSAPKSLDYLCEACRKHFATVQELLAAGGVAFDINPRLVRGLDYYTRTAFEVMAEGLGAQNTVVAGGRYDGLVEAMGGAAVPGIGFAIGVDRMALALQAIGSVSERPADAAIIAMGAAALKKAMEIARDLRANHFQIELLSPDRKLKTLLQRADKIGARFAVIIGDDEIAKSVAQLKDLKASSQREVPIAELAGALAESRREGKA